MSTDQSEEENFSVKGNRVLGSDAPQIIGLKSSISSWESAKDPSKSMLQNNELSSDWNGLSTNPSQSVPKCEEEGYFKLFLGCLYDGPIAWKPSQWNYHPVSTINTDIKVFNKQNNFSNIENVLYTIN